MHNWKKEIFSIPNILSLFRLLLIPVYTVLFLRAENPSDYWLAAGVLAVSTLTDMVDGKIARRFHMITNLGKILDPVADKATQCTLLVCLAVRHPVLWYVLALFVAKEGFMLVMGIVNLRRKKDAGRRAHERKNLHDDFVCQHDHPGAFSGGLIRCVKFAGGPLCCGYAVVLCRLFYGLFWKE